MPQFTRIVEETKPFIISSNLCEDKGIEILVGVNDQDYRGCQTSTRTGKTCLPWDSTIPATNGEESAAFGTDGGHSYCRNPDASGDTIWCYVGDPDSPKKELCDPIGAVTTNLCVNSDERLTGVKDDGYRGCQG